MNIFYRSISYFIVFALMSPSGIMAYDAKFVTGMKNEVLNSFELPVPEKAVDTKQVPKEGFEWLTSNIKKLWG